MSEDDRARNRFIVINVVGITGMGLVLLALAIHYRKVDLPEEAAWALAAIGLIEFFAIPHVLARLWRTPEG